MTPARPPPPSPSARLDNTDRWLAELWTADPGLADRAVSAAVDLVRDVTRAPRAAIADALRQPAGDPARASYDEWFRYGLRLVRLGLYGAGVQRGGAVPALVVAGRTRGLR